MFEIIIKQRHILWLTPFLLYPNPYRWQTGSFFTCVNHISKQRQHNNAHMCIRKCMYIECICTCIYLTAKGSYVARITCTKNEFNFNSTDCWVIFFKCPFLSFCRRCRRRRRISESIYQRVLISRGIQWQLGSFGWYPLQSAAAYVLFAFFLSRWHHLQCKEQQI